MFPVLILAQISFAQPSVFLSFQYLPPSTSGSHSQYSNASILFLSSCISCFSLSWLHSLKCLSISSISSFLNIFSAVAFSPAFLIAYVDLCLSLTVPCSVCSSLPLSDIFLATYLPLFVLLLTDSLLPSFFIQSPNFFPPPPFSRCTPSGH